MGRPTVPRLHPHRHPRGPARRDRDDGADLGCLLEFLLSLRSLQVPRTLRPTPTQRSRSLPTAQMSPEL